MAINNKVFDDGTSQALAAAPLKADDATVQGWRAGAALSVCAGCVVMAFPKGLLHVPCEQTRGLTQFSKSLPGFGGGR
ncbi:hypothetical protein [Paucibacter sp. PLA-PC-4]|uniref:hypothetical protein n=1 Tax=Paucibacter sp. PLA-PC-4 TaxID=2993655 RepID=UPI00224B94DC|nr:hypothetical protein [Paucibacter sp. PLA-PC-4]